MEPCFALAPSVESCTSSKHTIPLLLPPLMALGRGVLARVETPQFFAGERTGSPFVRTWRGAAGFAWWKPSRGVWLRLTRWRGCIWNMLGFPGGSDAFFLCYSHGRPWLPFPRVHGTRVIVTCVGMAAGGWLPPYFRLSKYTATFNRGRTTLFFFFSFISTDLFFISQ
jgi:hypothetical protein